MMNLHSKFHNINGIIEFILNEQMDWMGLSVLGFVYFFVFVF